MSFTDAGQPLPSPKPVRQALTALGLAEGIPPLRRIAEARRPFVHHRDYEFKKP